MKQLHIAVGVIRDANQRILISQRKPDCTYAGQWEFPGGKCEPGEPVEQALARELDEELGIQVQSARPLIRMSYRYPDRHVLLDTWEVTRWQGLPAGREGQRFEWVLPEDLQRYPMLEANGPILKAALLPDRYLITPLHGPRRSEFLTGLQHSLEAGIRLVRLRTPDIDDTAYATLAQDCVELCSQYKAALLLDRNPAMVSQVGAQGLHLSTAAMSRLPARPLVSGYWVAASCHNRAELLKAVALGLDFAVLGPVANTTTHPQATGMGWLAFTETLGELALPVYGLGGLGRQDLTQAWEARAQGVAGIRGLWASD